MGVYECENVIVEVSNICIYICKDILTVRRLVHIFVRY